MSSCAAIVIERIAVQCFSQVQNAAVAHCQLVWCDLWIYHPFFISISHVTFPCPFHVWSLPCPAQVGEVNEMPYTTVSNTLRHATNASYLIVSLYLSCLALYCFALQPPSATSTYALPYPSWMTCCTLGCWVRGTAQTTLTACIKGTHRAGWLRIWYITPSLSLPPPLSTSLPLPNNSTILFFSVPSRSRHRYCHHYEEIDRFFVRSCVNFLHLPLSHNISQSPTFPMPCCCEFTIHQSTLLHTRTLLYEILPCSFCPALPCPALPCLQYRILLPCSHILNLPLTRLDHL